ncbi:hypothetical protein QFZ75_000007 [Streptomyces sp. V3I8]|uniref:hypothetical protein n=1 Tax=Streptomyces sp. V3I8 TaxID=3042279 RepID=UPI0027850604|nr:hypothetical protein [Streptomyces sp. V3I8]MDQ1033591.1 hypothetical protein [Streptomyces sp. V3I8]
MDLEAWIAVAAVAISVAAAAVSIHQAKTAKDSAKFAREANELTRQQMAQQAVKDRQTDAEAYKAAQREADKVQIVLSSNGGSLTVKVTNHSLRTISDVTIVDVRPEDVGTWRSWKPNPNVGRKLSTTVWPLLHPGQDETAALWLLDENDAHLPQLPIKAAVEVRWQDDDGQWWSSTTGAETTRIEPPIA